MQKEHVEGVAPDPRDTTGQFMVKWMVERGSTIGWDTTLSWRLPMSLHPHPLPPVPADTAAIARRVFRKGNIYLTLRDQLGPLFDDTDFLPIYGHAGPSATSPALLSLVTIMQYMEQLTDEQAADAVRSRLDWKYCLGLPLDDSGFDATVLVDFRARLVARGSQELLLDRLVARLREHGLLRAGGRQRTDSTHVLAAIRVLNRLELVGETMRHALNRLAVVAPDWLLAASDPAWLERYAARIAGARLPRTQAERDRLIRQIGQDGFALLAAVAAPDTPRLVSEEQAMVILRRVWAQQYELGDDGPRFRPGTTVDAAADQIRSPYDPEARWSVKRETEWTGYKVHLSETCDAARPRLITAVQTTVATTSDEVVVERIHATLAQREVLPDRHLMDAGYVTGTDLVAGARTYRITIVGPVRANTSWQARAGGGYSSTAFTIDWDAEEATCPQGKRSATWRMVVSRTGRQAIQIHFRQADCRACPVRAQCTTGSRRSLTVLPQAEQEALVRARQEQETAAFAAEYAMRAGIEGTIAQGTRRSGLRRARYRGLAKTQLQHVITAAALDLIRAAAWLTEQPIRSTRTSAYAHLMAAAA
jgi:transposase